MSPRLKRAKNPSVSSSDPGGMMQFSMYPPPVVHHAAADVASLEAQWREGGAKSAGGPLVGFARFNSSMVLTDVNDDFCVLLGKPAKDMIGSNFDALFLVSLPYDKRTIISDGTIEFIQSEVIVSHQSGVSISADTSSFWKRAANGQLEFVIVFLKDMSFANAVPGSVFSSGIDCLTGTLNAQSIENKVDQAVRSANTNEVLTLMLLNLDEFQAVNDSFGYAAGNALLVAVAARLQLALNQRGALGRARADEFAVMVPNENIALHGECLPQALLDSLSEPFFIDGDEIYISASVGISHFPAHGSTREELVCAAESALRHVKKRGGRAFKLFDVGMANAAKTQLYFERHLRKALLRGEFELEFQPRVDLGSMRVVAMEALLRWNHPILGRVPPLDFIPIAEEKGLIVEIGKWVLLTACVKARQLADTMARPVRVSVNLSAHQLKCPDIYEQVRDVLEITGLPPYLLELELTESAMIEDFQRSALTLQQLKTLGIFLSVDDFGTGYSSLAYLQSFPFDTLKLDKTFVNHQGAGANNSKLVKALIDLSHALDLSVVAEGVETVEMLDFLRSADCDEVQGYLLSRPLGVVDLDAYLLST